MKWQSGLWGLVVFLVIAGLFSNSTATAKVAVDMVTINVIRNGFALGIDNDHCPMEHDPVMEPISAAEWAYDEFVSLSKCGLSKNSHPTDPNGGGAMFKNGPISNSGMGLPGVPAHMWQTYDLVALGVPGATPVTVDLMLELVSVGGTEFTAVIESSVDGENWTPRATLVDFPQENCGYWKYPLYCGTAVVDYAPYYRLALRSVWVDQLGQKWVIHHLNFSYETDEPATPIPTETVEPTPTPLPTPTPVSTSPVVPSLSIDDVTITEGSESKSASFQVTLSSVYTQSVTVNYETVAQTAVAGEDFMVLNDTVTFAPGESTKIIEVTIIDDDIDEADSESFSVSLTDPTNATIADGGGTGSIIDDDEAQLLLDSGLPVMEGDDGVATAVVTVSLTTETAFPVTVAYETSNDCCEPQFATAGEDYLAISGTLTFAAGESSKAVPILIYSDTKHEDDEFFNVNISNSSPVSVFNPSVLVYILNDDAADDTINEAFTIFVPFITNP